MIESAMLVSTILLTVYKGRRGKGRSERGGIWMQTITSKGGRSVASYPDYTNPEKRHIEIQGGSLTDISLQQNRPGEGIVFGNALVEDGSDHAKVVINGVERIITESDAPIAIPPFGDDALIQFKKG